MALVLVSAMRAASETDSEPEFRHMKLANGHPPVLWPISLRSARSARSCDRLGVLMLAIACGLALASMIACGAWPKPSLPSPPVAYSTAPVQYGKTAGREKRV